MARQDESDKSPNKYKGGLPPISSEEAAVGFMKRPTAPSTPSASDNHMPTAQPESHIAAASHATVERKPTNQPDRSERQAENDQPDVFEAAKLMKDAVIRLALHRPAAAWNSVANWCQQGWSETIHPWVNKIAPAISTALIVLAVAFCIHLKVLSASSISATPNGLDSRAQLGAHELFRNEVSLFPLEQEISLHQKDITQCLLGFNVIGDKVIKDPLSDAWWKFWQKEAEAFNDGDAGRNMSINALLYTMKSLKDARKLIKTTGQKLNTTSEDLQSHEQKIEKQSYDLIQELGLEASYLESITLSQGYKVPALETGARDLKLYLRFIDWVQRTFTGSRQTEVEAVEQAIKSAACGGIRNTVQNARNGVDKFVNGTKIADRKIDDLNMAFNEAIRGLTLTRSGLTTATEWSTKIDPRITEDIQATINLVSDKLKEAERQGRQMQKKLRVKVQTLECRKVELRGPHANSRARGHGKDEDDCIDKVDEHMPQYVQMVGALQNASTAWGC